MIRLIAIMKWERDLRHINVVADSRGDLQVVGTGMDSYRAIKLAETEQPDIAIVDYQIDCGGINIAALIKRKSPHTAIILISPYEDEKHASDAMIRGIAGYLVGKSDMDILDNIIYIIHAGGSYVSHRIVARTFQILPQLYRYQEFYQGLLSRINSRAPEVYRGPGILSQSEQRIIRMVGQGKSTREIGETLGLKPGTVRNYISILMHKIGVRSRQQMIFFALNYKRGLSDIEFSIPPSWPAPAVKIPPLLEARLNLEK
jgi:DNA-binding NarL/FixJ family response regulator